MAGQLTTLSYSKLMDPDGDFVILETTMAPGETEGNFKFLQGTGKWKGIKGSGKARAITNSRPNIKTPAILPASLNELRSDVKLN
jgi:hypothetical protein